MFNSYTNVNEDHRTIVKFPDVIRVHKHKAPTDESIRLANEFEKKARKNFVEKITLEECNNVLKGSVTIMRADHDLSIILCVSFELNGHKFYSEKELPCGDMMYHSKSKILQEAHLEVAAQIAVQLLINAKY